MKKTFLGIDVGTTSVSGVAVDCEGNCLSTVTMAHAADVDGLPAGVFEQDAHRLMAVTATVVARLEDECGKPESVGWTGQMHGIVGADADLRPMTNFVTWRDNRRYGGRVMSDWHSRGITPFMCLPVCALVCHEPVIDETFLHSWYLDEAGLTFPREWIPSVAEGCMLGDNQAGVYAAQRLFPGSVVVNLGTSGQLSVVRECPYEGRAVPGEAAENGSRRELRPFPGGRTLECRASMIGGAAWAALREKVQMSWEEMNVTDDPRVVSCATRIADDLFDGIELSGADAVVGVGNALVRNPALVRAIEARSGLTCRIPALPEMAACGAAFFAMDRLER